MTATATARIEIDAGRLGALIFARYQRFLERWELDAESTGDPAEDAKRFNLQNAAGRAALAHIEHLFKVAALTRGEDPGEAALHDLAAWRALMPAEPEEEEPASDESDLNG